MFTAGHPDLASVVDDIAITLLAFTVLPKKKCSESRRYLANFLNSCVPARRWNRSVLGVADTHQYRCTYMLLMSLPGFLFASSFLVQHTYLLPLSRSSRSRQETFYFLSSIRTKTADPGRITTRTIIVRGMSVSGCTRNNESTRLWVTTGVMKRNFRMRCSVAETTRERRTRKFHFASIINDIQSEAPRIRGGKDRRNAWRIIMRRTETRMVCGSKRSKNWCQHNVPNRIRTGLLDMV